jgi:hypothetical protein
MCKRLRKVPTKSALAVVFLRQQPKVVAKVVQLLKKHARFFHPTLQHIDINQPKAAGEKSTFPRRKTILHFSGVVTKQKAALK